jgi:hypothetical protein
MMGGMSTRQDSGLLLDDDLDCLRAVAEGGVYRLHIPSPGVPIIWSTTGRRVLPSSSCERLWRRELVAPLGGVTRFGGYDRHDFAITDLGRTVLGAAPSQAIPGSM